MKKSPCPFKEGGYITIMPDRGFHIVRRLLIKNVTVFFDEVIEISKSGRSDLINGKK